MQCLIKTIGNDALLGVASVSKKIDVQTFSRHNTPAHLADDDQEEANPVLKEPTSSKPKKTSTPKDKSKKKSSLKPKPSTKPNKTPQEDEMPVDVNVQSELVKATTETSSQLAATSHSQPQPPVTSQQVTESISREPISVVVTSLDVTTITPMPGSTQLESPITDNINTTISTVTTAIALKELGSDVPSTSVMPQMIIEVSPHDQSFSDLLDMDVDMPFSNQRDEDEPRPLSPVSEVQGTSEAATTPLPPSGGLEDSSIITKTSLVATAVIGSDPMDITAGSPQNQEQGAHDNLELEPGHGKTVSTEDRDSDDAIKLVDESKIKELTAKVEGLESEVCKLKELLTKKAQDKDHSTQTTPRVASPANTAGDLPYTSPSTQATSSGPGSINIDHLCNPQGPLYQMFHQLIDAHLKDLTVQMEQKYNTQLTMLNNALTDKVSEISRRQEDLRRQIQHLTCVTPPAPWFQEADEAKKGEKVSEKIDLAASKKAREAEQKRSLEKTIAGKKSVVQSSNLPTDLPSTEKETSTREVKVQYRKRKTRGTTDKTSEDPKDKTADAQSSVVTKIQKTTPAFSKPTPDPSDLDQMPISQLIK